MLQSRSITIIKIAGILTFFLLSASACSILGGSSADATPTPAPTSSIPGLQVIPPLACQVAEHAMVRVYQPQGDLIAWSPTNDTLAYIASTQGSTWNVGELNLLTAPLFDTPERLATQVAGELSWSPKATFIAYLGLRRSDNLYTIGLAYPDGRAARDFFPGEAARTDGYGSQKAVLEWKDEGRLSVFTSCGIDCLQGLDIGVLTGLTSPTGDPIEALENLWAVTTNHPVTIPTAYADLVGQLNWSPDESQIAYIDDNGYVWIIDVKTGSLYPLDIGTYGTAFETDWSFDGKYLAVQVDQTLKIFSFECP